MSQSGRFGTGGSGTSAVNTLTGNSGGAVPPTAGNIDIVGSGVVTVTGNPGTSTLTITSSATAGIVTLDGDSGSATGATVTIAGGSNIDTSAAASTLTVNLVNSPSVSGTLTAGTGITSTTGNIAASAGNITLPNTNGAGTQGEITFGGSRFISNFGGTNTFVGADSGNTTMTGFSSVALGSNALEANTTGSFNAAGGFLSQGLATTGNNNSSWGAGSMSSATGAASTNTAIGSGALNTATAPNNTIAIGYLAGSAYTTTESNNIIIGNTGVVADSATIRMGTTGVQTSAYVAGVAGVGVANKNMVTIDTTTGQLGSAALSTLTYTNVNSTPYVVVSTDEYLSVDSSGGIITVQLPNAATSGRVFIIKDRTGSASANNITVTTVGGAVNIDGATTFVMNTAYESVQVIGNGTSYEIF